MHVWTIALMLLGPSVVDSPQIGSLSREILVRGQPARDLTLGYWAVEDTVIDTTSPDKNFGGSHILTVGPGKTLLIKFGDLRRVIGANKKVTQARIVFTLSGGAPAPVQSISDVLVPWGEGPAQILTFTALVTTGAPALSATWRHRRAGENAIAWQQPGAAGVGDARPIPGARSISPNPETVVIEGIEAAVQRMLDRPYDNHGFALSFSGNMDFDSSQSRFGRPRLELTIASETPKSGPDLAILRISRTPEYPKYAPGEPLSGSQDGFEVKIPGPPSNPTAKHWPANGEEVTYTAVIRNQGDQPSTGFTARWSIRERPGSATEFDRTLAPGEETTITLKNNYRDPGSDRRGPTIGLKIEPKGADAFAFNNGLSIHEAGLAIGFRFAPELVQGIADQHPLGARTPDEFAQALVSLWNEVILPQSRFSFAPDGALERIRLQSVESGGNETGLIEAFDAPNLDVSVALGKDLPMSSHIVVRAVIRAIGEQLGLPNLYAINPFKRDAPPVTIGGLKIDRTSQDAWAGIMGGGDTRFDGLVPSTITPPSEPLDSPMFDAMPMEATGLLDATSVGALQDALGHRRGFVSDAFMRLPSIPFIRIYDMSGAPVRNATVEVYPMAGGRIVANEPFARAQTGPDGSVILPSRPTQLPEGFKTLLGYSPPSSIFGRVDPTGGNGVLLLRVIAGGQADFVYLKVWQLADTFRRNPTPAPFFDVRVNIGGDIDPGTNLANNRIVTDSAGSLPARLAALIDDQIGTESDLPDAKDAWIDIDLGRDRIFGEIRLFAKGPFWEKFRIVTYATGQQPTEGKLFAREASWTWTAENRSSDESNGIRSVPYRNIGLRARFIRIIRMAEGPPAKLAEIKIFPLRG